LFRAGDRDTVFNLVYEDLAKGRTFAKRFRVGGYTRDRRYELGSSKKTRVLLVSVSSPCFSHVKLKKKPRIKTDLYLAFEDQLVKGRGANGILISKHPVSSAKEISQTVYQNRIASDSDGSNGEPTARKQPLLFPGSKN
jgi:topoisomerase-4 subunit A